MQERESHSGRAIRQVGVATIANGVLRPRVWVLVWGQSVGTHEQRVLC